MKPSHVVIRCTDYRFVLPTMLWLKNLGIGESFEDVAAAGSTKNIVDPYDAADVEFMLRQIAISRKLHDIKSVVLVNHLGCDAYGNGTFASVAEEHDRHVRDLTTAKITIEHRFEGFDVTAILARMDENGQVDFEKII